MFDTAQMILVLCGATLLCLILIVILLIVQGAGRSRTRKEIRTLEDHIRLMLDSMEEFQEQQNGQQREETMRSLHHLNESLTSTINYTGSTHAEQLAKIQYRTEETLVRSLNQSEYRLDSLRKTMDENLRLLREDNAKQLSEMRATVDEKLNETLEKRLSSSFSQVSERLEQVYRSLGEMHSLASGVGDLKRMLSNVKTRGVWGEIQLGALLEEALTEGQYQRNVAVVPHSGERVEFAVCLPGREDDGVPVYLPIDSKFPQEDYARLTEAAANADQEAVEAAQKALLTAVRTEAKRIGKYIAPPHTTDFAVMFLPLEGLYAEVMRHSDVVEVIQREQRVLIAGPSTLLALLNSLQMGFRTLAIEQRSAEVWKLLGAVKGDFGSFAAILQKTQEKLQQATDSIDSAFVKTRTIEKRLRNVEALEAGEAQRFLDEE